jgi:hypothetical protein
MGGPSQSSAWSNSWPPLLALPSSLLPFPLPSLLPMGPEGRGQSDNAQAFNTWQTACTDTVGLLLTFVERASSSPPNNNGYGGGGTIARSALTHLAGTGRVKSANYSTCMHRLARVVASPMHPGSRDNNDCNGSGPELRGGGSGRYRTRNLRCWCVRSRYGLQGGPGPVCLGGEQHQGKLGNGLWWCGGWGWQQQGRGGEGPPWHDCRRQGRQRLHCERPRRMAIAIARAPTPTHATGKGGNGKDVIVLVAVVVGRGVKTNNN